MPLPSFLARSMSINSTWEAEYMHNLLAVNLLAVTRGHNVQVLGGTFVSFARQCLSPMSLAPSLHPSLLTGASLKLAIQNPKGRMWTMVAGGGACVIYADTVSVLYLLPLQGSAVIYRRSVGRLCLVGME